MTVLNTSRTYTRPYRPWLSVIQGGHIKAGIDNNCP
jgi:hypothetical protein